jgi:hypothetical protein
MPFTGPIKLDDHSDLAYEKDYEIFKEAHQGDYLL